MAGYTAQPVGVIFVMRCVCFSNQPVVLSSSSSYALGVSFDTSRQFRACWLAPSHPSFYAMERQHTPKRRRVDAGVQSGDIHLSTVFWLNSHDRLVLGSPDFRGYRVVGAISRMGSWGGGGVLVKTSKVCDP